MITKKERNPDVKAINGVYQVKAGPSRSERLRKRLQSFFPWFYAPRDTYLANRVIRFPNSLQGAPETHYDPIANEWIRPIMQECEIGAFGVRDTGKWECEIWKTIPSRWESLKTRIAWYAEYIFLAYFARSDKSVLESMRKRGHGV